MVKSREDIPKLEDGSLDIESWIPLLNIRQDNLVTSEIRLVADFVSAIPVHGNSYLSSGAELSDLLVNLGMDKTVIIAALLYRPLRAEAINARAALASLSKVGVADAINLVESVISMGTVSLLEMTNTRMQTIEARDQVDNVRKMFVSLLDDPRVAVLKLAERIIALRLAKDASEVRRKRIAKEAYLVFAPLAERLGIWQLKWELEDLSLRYLEPDIYMGIARQLDLRRTEREREIDEIVALLLKALEDRGIKANVLGRAKNIFSIYQKMKAKRIGVDEVYDIRAVRVLVGSVSDCYSSLGVIHTLWHHIPSEFDDYLANPKENGYRSIHTAVIGPTGEPLEVQIRTFDMDEEAELGVCAHWSYKAEGEEDQFYTEKMNWFRQFVDMSEETFAGSFLQTMRSQFSRYDKDERIFIYTPQGHVIDLTVGATPVDFAYRVHTEVGHRCIGARIDGRPVRLNSALKTGQRVEILTSKFECPERTWLDSRLGFVKTNRAREKIQSWFRNRPNYENRAFAVTMLSDMFGRVYMEYPDERRMEIVSESLGYLSVDELMSALAIGDCHVPDIFDGLDGSSNRVSGGVFSTSYPVKDKSFTILINASDRDDLLRDLTILLSESGVSITSVSSRLEEDSIKASIFLEVRLSGWQELILIIEGLSHVPDVNDVRLSVDDRQVLGRW